MVCGSVPPVIRERSSGDKDCDSLRASGESRAVGRATGTLSLSSLE